MSAVAVVTCLNGSMLCQPSRSRDGERDRVHDRPLLLAAALMNWHGLTAGDQSPRGAIVPDGVDRGL